MKRRHFLQFAGSALATLGISQLDIQRQGLQYAKVLAQGTSRKIALLVGINDYPDTAGFSKLAGCVNDVELQKELLTYRFGFNEKDIHILTDAQATRQGIIDAFQELSKQIKPSDVFVYHYSGHGSQVVDLDKDHSDGLNSTFVTYDSTLPPNFPAEGGEVLDITGHSLFLLMKSVNTENMTIVLDSCHSGGGTRGNLRIRSRDGGAQLQASPKEAELQAQLLSQLKYDRSKYIDERRKGVARGVVISGAKRDQPAADASFGDLNAGAFTYVLTQYLWQQTSDQAVSSLIPTVARSTSGLSNQRQEPDYEFEPNSNNDQQSLYFLKDSLPPAEGVIREFTAGKADLWLGGISPQSINNFEPGSSFIVIDEQNKKVSEIELETRDGLKGQGKIVGNSSAIKSGMLIQEKSRTLPSDFKLIIGLHPSLGNDATAAQQALDKLPRVKAMPLLQGSVNYILGRMTEAIRQDQLQVKPAKDVAPIGAIGLFTQGLDLIPGSFGSPNENVTDAITRLNAKLKSLLAVQIVKTTFNVDSSKLNISVAMSPEGQDNKLLAAVTPSRGVNKTTGQPKKIAPTITDASRLPLETPVQFQVTNNESSNLYLSLIVIDPTGEMTVVFPNSWATTDDATVVTSAQTLLIPDQSKGDTFQLITQEPKGTIEVLIVASKKPLTQALLKLQQVASSENNSRGPVTLTEPVNVMDSLLDDLNQGGTRGTRGGLGAKARSIDTDELATMSITFEVI